MYLACTAKHSQCTASLAQRFDDRQNDVVRWESRAAFTGLQSGTPLAFEAWFQIVLNPMRSNDKHPNTKPIRTSGSPITSILHFRFARFDDRSGHWLFYRRSISASVLDDVSDLPLVHTTRKAWQTQSSNLGWIHCWSVARLSRLLVLFFLTISRRSDADSDRQPTTSVECVVLEQTRHLARTAASIVNCKRK